MASNSALNDPADRVKRLAAQRLVLSDPSTPRLLARELERQAGMIGFVDAFWFVTLTFVVLAPPLLLFRRKANAAGSDPRLPGCNSV